MSCFVEFRSQQDPCENNCNRDRHFYAKLIRSITGERPLLNNLCDRKLLVGGTIIQTAIDRGGHGSVFDHVGVYK